LTNLLTIFANNVLPIFLAAGAGYLVSKYTHLSPRAISQLAFNIFIPCLLFKLLTTSDLSNADILRMVGFTITSVILIGVVTWGVARAMRAEKRMVSALLLTIMFANSGNYGLSLNLFAFGELAMAYASLYFATSIILINTLGVLIANLGTANLTKAALGLLKTPVIYAVLAALYYNYSGWNLPTPVNRTILLLADAAVPLMIVLMGVQLQQSRWSGQGKALSLATGMRLIAAPLLAYPVAILFGLSGASLQAGITESALPTAVMITVLATEYKVEPAFVTMAVVASTLLSPLTITPILAMLGA